MNIAPHDYVPPQAQQIDTLPPAIVAYLDGTDLLTKTQALRISTVDAANWPHASLLSTGDMVAMPSGRLRFAVFAKSSTTANILRDQRVTITFHKAPYASVSSGVTFDIHEKGPVLARWQQQIKALRAAS